MYRFHAVGWALFAAQGITAESEFQVAWGYQTSIWWFNPTVPMVILLTYMHGFNGYATFNMGMVPRAIQSLSVYIFLTSLAIFTTTTSLLGFSGQYERRIVEAGFCGGFVAQWFMAALVRHPGFESRSCQFFAFLLSLSAGWIPIKCSY